jgi:serine/threonine protein kinase
MPECASDIYAMGATLHFLLTGQDPEPISTSHPKRVDDSISEKLNALVERATALNTAKRYAKVEELLTDLEST